MKKKLLWIIIGFALIIIVGGVFYLKYTHSPEYSLLQVQKAFARHDRNAFEKYVDVDSLVDNLIDQILNSDTSQEKKKDQWEEFGELLGKGLVMMIKPQLVKLIKGELLKLVETGKVEEKPKDNQFASSNLGVFGKLFSKKGKEESKIKYVKKEGNIVLVGVEVYEPEYDTFLTLELKMRNMGNYWQIIAITNFQEYLKKIEELKKEKIAKINKPIIERINKTLVKVSGSSEDPMNGDLISGLS